VRSRLLSRLVFIAYFFEVGLVLIVVPWSTFWDHNFFAESIPWVGRLADSGFVRGAVSGLGVANLWTALADLASVVANRRHAAAVNAE